MKAILLKDFGDTDQLYFGEIPAPEPQENEIRIRVKATAVNRADILQRRGRYPPPEGASNILGLEAAGIVDRVGPGCRRWKKGDRVLGLLPGGGYAEYAVLHQQMAMAIPANLRFEQAAAIPEVFLTAYQAVGWLGQLKAGQKVLIHAGASGVGTAAIQVAREMGGTIFITAGDPRKLEACLQLGAQAAVNYRNGPFEPAIRQAAAGGHIDLIVDFVGAPHWEQNISLLGVDGRLILLSLLGGSRLQSMDLSVVLKKRLQISGSTLRNRTLNYKIRLTEEFADFALPRFSDGRLTPVIDSVFPWHNAGEAHRYMEANKNIGKIVLRVNGE